MATQNRKNTQPTTAKSKKNDNEKSEIKSWGGLDQSTNISWQVMLGDATDCLNQLHPESIHCAITSPPYYWQRDYGEIGQIGLEKSINEYVTRVADVMDATRRVLRKDGALFLNLGDTYYSAKGQPKGDDKKNQARRFGLRAVDASGLGVPRKTAIGIPWRVMLEMISRGWILRSTIIWAKAAPIPEPTAHDRPWRTFEPIFLFAKSPKYYFKREHLNGEEDIWQIADRANGTKAKHFATFPEALVEKCINTGCPERGTVLDPFAGTGTVLRVANRLNRSSVGIDISPSYCKHMASLFMEV